VRAGLLIPIYDHGATIRGVVESLAVHGLPLLVVDDGSAAPTRAAVDALPREFDFVRVLRRERNGGRGVALKTGYRWLHEHGFSHVIHLDADAQHDARDVPRFLEAMRRHPDALVLGTPIFDASVPRSRLYGRQLSRWLVWLSTLSFEIDDPLCGFRGVPLAPVIALLDRVRTGDHMDFEPDLAVRLVWEGHPVVNVPTRVVYPPDGLSHFDVVWDDLRLAWLYVRTVGGMLRRSPRLAAHRRRPLEIASVGAPAPDAGSPR
jgi:glycosyltransferase involved in cell wall biosynthesis